MKLAHASKRTVSLFTGRTDVEDHAAGRDGTRPIHRPLVLVSPKPAWSYVGGSWRCKGTRGEVVVTQTRDGWRVGEDVFDTIIAAATHAEAQVE